MVLLYSLHHVHYLETVIYIYIYIYIDTNLNFSDVFVFTFGLENILSVHSIELAGCRYCWSAAVGRTA
jgi:hypothetical protein